MRKRQQRHDIIRDIIREHNVKTQRDLANQLQAAGYECTQATISRDIMDMGLVKSREGYYVLPEEMRLQRMVSELVEEVHVAGNMVVVKTFSGGAAGVSAALDKASLRGALGTVAGDNTIMIAAESLRLPSKLSAPSTDCDDASRRLYFFAGTLFSLHSPHACTKQQRPSRPALTHVTTKSRGAHDCNPTQTSALGPRIS
ncbi:hypothetical protein [Eggerthella sinensis]|uniref:arginine repressor n=1 Tax=Eggerthella sinensis TaxID=242230 RepID=UPI0022E6F2EF|nr:hypothetical protein [Eggerthella sinensis]